MIMTEIKQYFTAKEAAEYLSMKVKTFYNYVSLGKIPFRKPNNGPKRYLKKDLDSYMGKRKFSDTSEDFKI